MESTAHAAYGAAVCRSACCLAGRRQASVGDLVDRGAPRNYQLAKTELARCLGDLPFYPGLGNHEYYPEADEEDYHTAEAYCAAWGRPVRYAWTAGSERVACIMLDHRYLHGPGAWKTWCPPETLAFLDETLAEHAERVAVIFAHCPLSLLPDQWCEQHARPGRFMQDSHLVVYGHGLDFRF